MEIKANNKMCTLCKIEKITSEFGKDKYAKDGLTYQCLSCRKALKDPNYNKEYYQKNKVSILKMVSDYAEKNEEKLKESKKLYVIKNKEKIDNYQAEYRAKNKEKSRKTSKLWRENNKRAVLAHNAKRRADKLRATPKWLSKEQKEEIKQIYLNCPPGFHVDHIVPLKGETVRGLHVPWNLQYLSAKENLKKKNRLIA